MLNLKLKSSWYGWGNNDSAYEESFNKNFNISCNKDRLKNPIYIFILTAMINLKLLVPVYFNEKNVYFVKFCFG